MSKFIFVTGGVVSGLGKGITAASLGALLKAQGYKVAAIKLDPYMNVDPGTMNPLEHGEVFVTNDGTETDLDLGHYERFIDENLNKYSNITSGKIYYNVITKERKGGYLGHTVQIIPHVTDEIKRIIYKNAEKTQADIMLIEIGGTVGDIESQPFLETIRQIKIEHRDDCLFIHVVLIPYISGSNEFKTKPAQHSVKELRSIGIMPDIIVTRADNKLSNNILDKIALFCNVKKENVIENETLEHLYQCPIMLHNNKLDEAVCSILKLEHKQADLSSWININDKLKNLKGDVKIAIVGKYIDLRDAYLSVVESLYHAGIHHGTKVDIKWIDSESLEGNDYADKLKDVSGILVPGGFGTRGIEGKINACRYARENNIPYFGICLGMQIAVIEFARNVCKISDATSGEFDSSSTHKVIDLMDSQVDVENKGGTMRLGAYPCVINPDSKLHEIYNEDEIMERHRHRYEFNNSYRDIMIQNGLIISGTSPDNTLVETIEIKDHNFFVAVQYHPEFKSRPHNAHPIFKAFVKASINNKI